LAHYHLITALATRGLRGNTAAMEKLAHYLGVEQSARSVRELAARLGVTESAQVRNLEYVFSPQELYALVPRCCRRWSGSERGGRGGPGAGCRG